VPHADEVCMKYIITGHVQIRFSYLWHDFTCLSRKYTFYAFRYVDYNLKDI
jgi:hypothetical protein